MKRFIIMTAVFAVALGRAWAQDGERKKEAPKAEGQKEAPKKEGDRKEGEGVSNDGFLTLDQVDVNGDGKITRAELEAALKKVGPARKDGEKKAEGAKEGAKDGEKKAGPRDGEKKPVEKKDGERKPEGGKKDGEK